MIEAFKNILFNTFIIVGLIAICLILICCLIELLNRIFKFTKYIIMYFEYKRNDDLYDLKDKVMVAKDGTISHSCVNDLDEQIRILEKAIQTQNNIKELQEKYKIDISTTKDKAHSGEKNPQKKKNRAIRKNF